MAEKNYDNNESYSEHVGRNHDPNRSTKEVAQIIRAYVKEKYPDYRFAVSAPSIQKVSVELKESPIDIYKTYEELTPQENGHLYSVALKKGVINEKFRGTKEEFEDLWAKHGDAAFKCLNDATQAVVKDVDSFVTSYNSQDIDPMHDYFYADFYYNGCLRGNGEDVKIVPRTADQKQHKENGSGIEEKNQQAVKTKEAEKSQEPVKKKKKYRGR